MGGRGKGMGRRERKAYGTMWKAKSGVQDGVEAGTAYDRGENKESEAELTIHTRANSCCAPSQTSRARLALLALALRLELAEGTRVPLI